MRPTERLQRKVRKGFLTEHEAVEALQTWPTFKLDLADLHFAADCVDSFSVKLAAQGQHGHILTF